ncbi:MAG: hypothetical protein PHW03_00625 [Eubacteriales bacterium]|nr:hypothetical protein [Eubacteriales bacterium]MDD4389286.1 hypothetical protein [Eubacteriales bacterium]
MSDKEYIENCKALLARVENDIDDPRAKNIAVLVRTINKKKYYLDYQFFTKKLEIQPDRAKKERMEIMPLKILRERILAEINSAE